MTHALTAQWPDNMTAGVANAYEEYQTTQFISKQGRPKHIKIKKKIAFPLSQIGHQDSLTLGLLNDDLSTSDVTESNKTER
jgi:hypothetical protein